MDRPMRVAFTGPSGSGKTTLVQYVQEKYQLPWYNGSSGVVKSEEQNAFLMASGLAVGEGHARVIQTGHMNPYAAKLNQRAILYSRIEKFKMAAQAEESFVTDRSLFDNIVYYIMQASLYETEQDTEQFIREALSAMMYLTHIIFIPTAIPVENNGSRVANWYYQRAVNSIFQEVLKMDLTKSYAIPPMLELHDSRLKQRKDHIDSFFAVKRR
jgi:deoxyadenosine/deoxycytidine kinase